RLHQRPNRLHGQRAVAGGVPIEHQRFTDFIHSPTSATAAATISGLAGRNCFSSLGCSAGGGSASMNSAGAGQRRTVLLSTTNARRTRGASRCSSHARPSVKASIHAWAVPGSISAAGVRSSDKQASRCSPVRISTSSHAITLHFLQCHYPLRLLAHRPLVSFARTLRRRHEPRRGIGNLLGLGLGQNRPSLDVANGLPDLPQQRAGLLLGEALAAQECEASPPDRIGRLFGGRASV